MSELAATAVAMKAAQTQHSAQILMAKKAHEMEQSVVNMLTEAVQNAKSLAPDGMGTQVDKSA